MPVPKLLLVALVLTMLGPMMATQLTDFTRYVFETASQVSK